MGKKKQPFYRIVAADSRSRRDGKYIEKIGYYNPITNPAEIEIDEEKAFYWLKNGAIPTETVKSLFSKTGIMLKWHHIRNGHDEAKVEEEYKKWELLQLERQKREEALVAQAKREKEPAADAEVSAPETEEESVPEIKEVSPAENMEEAVDSQSEDQAPDQEKEEPKSEEPTSEIPN
jgi:small subunit ribosomal protein S16